MVKKSELIAWVEGEPGRIARWNAAEGNGGRRLIADYLDEYSDNPCIVDDLAHDLGHPCWDDGI